MKALLLLLFGCSSAATCACDREASKRKSAEQRSRGDPAELAPPADECSRAADCADDDPCTVEACNRARCVSSPARAGTDCDDANVCNGVATCDGNGRCVPGSAPRVDDGNPCTVDACDPATGVTHEPVVVDDGDACTTDRCDPVAGTIRHDSIDVDDGDDCTKDSCDPETGVKHEPQSTFYTCQPSCGDGFHAASRSPSAACGARDALRLFCMPDCGDSFYSCDPQCPAGYDKRAEPKGGQCGPESPTILYCVRT